MKPITDDIVLALIKGAEKRQSKTRAHAGKRKPSARIIDFTRRDESSVASDPGGRVIALDFVRRAGQFRLTVSGVFCFAPRS